MANSIALEKPQSGEQSRRPEFDFTPSLVPTNGEQPLRGAPHGIETLLTTQEASGVLKIHPKVLERMAKRGEVPAFKVGKFWRYRAGSVTSSV